MKKKLPFAALTMAGILGASVWLQPLTAYAAAWERSGNVYEMPDGSPITGVFRRGIDVSHWQQDVDWNQVAADDVDFVMLGTRYKGEVDPNFRKNADAAYAAGVELGAYIYSYATSVEMAEQEADFILNLVKDYPISYPIAFDAEDAGTLGTLPPEQVSQIINAFCKKIEDAGYHPMVYANEYWLNNKIDRGSLNYDVWVARYNVMYTYDSPAIWQATNTGSVNGISGNVDIDFQFKDYSSVIPADTWREIGGNRYYYQNHVMQKNAWIHDGSGWYYMNSSGNPAKGWQEFHDGTYYLEEPDGRMAEGWRELDRNYYYFNSSGRMTTGWQDVGGTWYHMDSEGRMQTGWQDIEGKRYYLSSSGAMQTGWQDIDGARYYLNASGAMQTGWQNVDGTWYYLGGDGKRRTDWQQVGESWYYLDGEGRMLTGWQDIGGSRYYLSGSGAMLTGWQEIDGTWYYLGTDGRMAAGWQDIGGKRYYLGTDGRMAVGWQNIDGTWYYLNSDGSMATGWKKTGETWYYMNAEGHMQTGWIEVDGALYYLNESGAMAANTILDRNGVKYQAGGNGVCTEVPADSTAGETTQSTEETAPSGSGHQSGPAGPASDF